MITCPDCGHLNEAEALACGRCGRRLSAQSNRTESIPAPSNPIQDPTKAVGLLFGMLGILVVYSLAVAVSMLWMAQPASLVEALIFALLAADAAILMAAVRGWMGPGPIGRLSVWVLGLIPYFGWVIVYGLGHGLAALIQRSKTNAALLALLIWIGVLVLCLGAHLLVTGAQGLGSVK